MLAYFKENLQLYILLLLWVVAGIFGGPVIYGLVPLTMLLLARKELYEELFIGFWLVLILSDSLWPNLLFAKSLKNIHIVMLAAIFFMQRKNFSPFNDYFKRFIPFYIVAFIALIYSASFSVSIQKTISYILLFITIPNYIQTIYRRNGDVFFKRLLYFCMVIYALCFFLRIFFPDIGISHHGRLTGIFGNPNGLGMFCVLTFLLYSVIVEHFPNLLSKNEKRFFVITVIALTILSGSRNAATALFLFLFLSRFYRVSPILGFAVLLVVGTASVIISNNLVEIIQSLGLSEFFRLNTLEEGAGRIIAWKFAWQQLQDHFFLGRGFAFDEYIMRKNYAMLSPLGHEGGVHNTYLIIWMNTGLIGLLLFLGSFFSTFIQGSKKTRLALPVMYAIMFTIMFEPWLAASLNPFTTIYLVIVTIILSPEIGKAKNSDEENDRSEGEIKPLAA